MGERLKKVFFIVFLGPVLIALFILGWTLYYFGERKRDGKRGRS